MIERLEAVSRQLVSGEVAHATILEATSLLREQIALRATSTEKDGCLLAWQVRKVRDYIDAHITGPVLVADLCTLIQRSQAHFSRSFKRTFGHSPRAFVIRCRVELAARYMLRSQASLSEIALRCGFTDQAHLCKRFRQLMGQPPGVWRRARRAAELSGAGSESSRQQAAWQATDVGDRREADPGAVARWGLLRHRLTENGPP